MYNYNELKPNLFTEENQRRFLAIRDNIARHLKLSGAVTMGKAIAAEGGDSWINMACVDRLVELGELREVPTNGAAQDRIFLPRPERDV